MNNPESFNSHNSELTVNEIHEKKIISCIANGFDFDYITGKDGKRWENTTEADENAVLEKWHNDEVAANTDERIFLSRIRRPDHTERIETVFEGINTRHGKTILNALLGNPDNMADAMGPADLQNFLGMYPTPLSAKEWKINSATGQKDIINIEGSYARANRFLTERIAPNNTAAKAREYAIDIESFFRNVYGKSYQYFESLRALEVKARAFSGGNALSSHETPALDLGIASVNERGAEVPADLRSFYCDEYSGVYGVFAGDNEKGTGKEALNLMVPNYGIETNNDIGNVLGDANGALSAEQRGGYSAAAIGKVLVDNNGKHFIYAFKGEGEIYLCRGDGVVKITGRGFETTNNSAAFNAIHSGRIDLAPKDVLVFSTQRLDVSDREIALMTRAVGAGNAALDLLKRDGKPVQKTAFVVKV